MELTQARVRELFDYRDDGSLIRRKSSGPAKAGSVAGSMDTRGHIQVRVNRILVHAHRVIFLWHHGYLPDEVDHRDMDKANNRIENLREATRSQNIANRSLRSDNKSGFKGVSFRKDVGKWVASIQKDKKRICLGAYIRLEDASAAYASAAREMYGEFARL